MHLVFSILVYSRAFLEKDCLSEQVWPRTKRNHITWFLTIWHLFSFNWTDSDKDCIEISRYSDNFEFLSEYYKLARNKTLILLHWVLYKHWRSSMSIKWNQIWVCTCFIPRKIFVTMSSCSISHFMLTLRWPLLSFKKLKVILCSTLYIILVPSAQQLCNFGN